MNFATRSGSSQTRVAPSHPSETPGHQLISSISSTRARRSLFPLPSTTTVNHVSQEPRTGRARNFYGKSRSINHRKETQTWRPGEILPTCRNQPRSQGLAKSTSTFALDPNESPADDSGEDDNSHDYFDMEPEFTFEHPNTHEQQQLGFWQDVKSLFSDEFLKVNTTLTELGNRIGKIETAVTDLESQVKELASDGSLSSSSATSSSNEGSRKRRRLSPLALQVRQIN